MTMLRDSRAMWAWCALAVGLIAAFLYGPAIVAGGTHLGGTFRGAPPPGAVGDGFVAYWRAGEGSVPAGLASLTDYWQRYHVAKAVIAAALLGVLVVLARRLWRDYGVAGMGTTRSVSIAVAGAAVSASAAGAALVVMANVQGAIAPLSSLFSILPTADAHGALRQTESEVVTSLQTGASSPVVQRLTADFSTYHVVVAVGSVLLGVLAVGLSAWMFRSRRRGSVMAGSGFAVIAVAMGVLVVANVGSAANPGEALLLFFGHA